MKNSMRQIYDQFAATYEKNRGLFDMSEVLASFYGLLNVKNGRLLDVGCGSGEPFARFFIDRGWDVQGVDFSRRQLELAARYVPEMQTVCVDMRKAEYPSDSFDAITAIYSLFHIAVSAQTTLLKKFYLWLRPGGKILFTYATKEYTGSDEFAGYKEFLGQQLYYSHKTPAALQLDLKKIGFEITATDYRIIGGETFLWITATKAG